MMYSMRGTWCPLLFKSAAYRSGPKHARRKKTKKSGRGAFIELSVGPMDPDAMLFGLGYVVAEYSQVGPNLAKRCLDIG
jgi:hypothetical protein